MLKIVLFAACLASAQDFEVASIKPNKSGRGDSHTHTDQGRMTAVNVSLRSLIVMAYGIRDYQLEGPDWLRDERFDIAAKFSEALPSNREKYDAALQSAMVKMLVERFRISTHKISKTFTIYALAVEKRGIKFTEVPDSDSHHQDSNNTHYKGQCVSMQSFADFLSRRVDRPVLDMTGLKGFYDLTLDWVPDSATSDDNPAGVSLPVALQEQLGLKFELRKAPIEVVVVDRIEKAPTEN